MKKGKSCGCGHEKMERKGKGKGKGYVEIEIKMSRAPKKATIVKSRRQAVAIALSSAGMSKKRK